MCLQAKMSLDRSSGGTEAGVCTSSTADSSASARKLFFPERMKFSATVNALLTRLWKPRRRGRPPTQRVILLGRIQLKRDLRVDLAGPDVVERRWNTSDQHAGAVQSLRIVQNWLQMQPLFTLIGRQSPFFSPTKLKCDFRYTLE